MIVFPNAKINLGLNICRRRPDGYHDIATVMTPIGWRDTLEIVPADDSVTRLQVLGHAIECPPEKNLVMKAYRALCSEYPLPPGHLYLYKNIPDGAGLGGGSADASFTLRCLNSLFDLGITDDNLARIAATLGADCPFFIYNRPMLATGTGIELADIDIDFDHYGLLVVKVPGTAVSTAMAYSQITPHIPDRELSQDLTSLPVSDWSKYVVNDFEPVIFALQPRVRQLKEQLLAAGASYAAMSGSGSAVFGIFGSVEEATSAADMFCGCDKWAGPLSNHF